ncbi:hypothetical protein [Psychromonas aquatilis]|uniref:Outer membrane protein beta-barrel domain-containing protein n=1 Tax=Psychromonas aquatilis TaxID=2005072 RepID=A0ABU9GN81_9GAMM
MKIHQGLITAIALSSFAYPAFAENPDTQENYLGEYVKVTAFLGAKLDIETDDGTHNDYRDDSARFSQAIALNWAYAKNAEGELLFSNSQRTGPVSEQYIQYLHVGGRILFRNSTPFSTSIALGAGATYINPQGNEYDDDFALSGNMALGARYQLSEQFALRSDLRIYGTLLRDGHNESMCSATDCDKGYFLETELLAGVEYTF